MMYLTNYSLSTTDGRPTKTYPNQDPSGFVGAGQEEAAGYRTNVSAQAQRHAIQADDRRVLGVKQANL